MQVVRTVLEATEHNQFGIVERIGLRYIDLIQLREDETYRSYLRAPRRAGDGCSPSCIIENAFGNGLVEAGESCDDGNMMSEDGCSKSCCSEAAG